MTTIARRHGRTPADQRRTVEALQRAAASIAIGALWVCILWMVAP